MNDGRRFQRCRDMVKFLIAKIHEEREDNAEIYIKDKKGTAIPAKSIAAVYASSYLLIHLKLTGYA